MQNNLNINNIVIKLLKKLKNKKIFLKDSLEASSTSWSHYYLHTLNKDFEIYSEIDLILLCYGCKLNLILDDKLAYLSFLLPNKFKNHINIVIDSCNELHFEP